MISLILLPFALASTHTGYETDSDLEWYPNMNLGNSVTFASQNLLSQVKLGAKLIAHKLPKARCQDDNAWHWTINDNQPSGLDLVEYEEYLTLTSDDICARDATACFDASKKDDLLSKMSSAVGNAFKDFEPLINKCVEVFKAEIKKNNEKCKVDDMATWEILRQKPTCTLKYKELTAGGLLDKYIKVNNLQQWTTFNIFDPVVKDAAKKAFFENGGKCLRVISESEKIDPATCEVVTHFESDALTKSTGNAILVMMSIAAATAILGAIIIAFFYGWKYCKTKNNNQSDYRASQA